jgi:hypothetical protein
LKHAILFLFSFALFDATYAQNDPASQKFIRSVFAYDGIVYSSMLNEEIIAKMKDAFKRDTIFSMFKTEEGKFADTLVFSQEEKRYIETKITNLKFNAWRPGLIENSKFIQTNYLKKMVSKPGGWQYFHRHFGSVVYWFSKPIFVRNNTLSIFYIGYSCDGLCGSENLSVYVKVNNKWTFTGFNLYNGIN